MAKKRFCYDYPRPMVTVDCVLLRVHERRLEVLLVRRGAAPHKGAWALPGGFIRMKEPLEAAVARELAEETGIRDISFLIQLGAYGNPDRDPRGRVISVGFIGIIPGEGPEPQGGDDASETRWHPVETTPKALAFDHASIIGDALLRLAAGGRTSGVLFAFLKDPFTADGVRDVLHAVYGVELNPREYLAPYLKEGIVRRAGKAGKYRFVGERR